MAIRAYNNLRSVLRLPGVRVGIGVFCVIIMCFFAYPHLIHKMAEKGHGNLLQFYLQELMEPIIAINFDWAVVKFGIVVSLGALVFEVLVLGWSHSSLRRLMRLDDKTSVNDVFYWAMGVLQLNGVVRFILTLGGASVIVFLLKKLDLDFQLIDKIEVPFLQYLAAFLFIDFMGYFQHRLAHTLGWWWELHKIHHSAEKFNMITFYRTHVLESLPRAIVYSVPYAVFGDASSFVFYYVVLELQSMLVHSEIQYKWGWLEKYLLVSPRNHKIHHSIDPAHHHKNFGFTLIIWDRIFGTWYEPKDGESIEIGLIHNPFNRSNPVYDMLLAYANSVMALFGSQQYRNTSR